MRRLRRAAAPLLVGVVATAISAAASWVPSYWSDEIATVRAVSLSPGQLWPFLGVKDAVHGAYYLLLHAWTLLAGTSELATRLPSAVVVGVAAGGLVVVGRQLARLRSGPSGEPRSGGASSSDRPMPAAATQPPGLADAAASRLGILAGLVLAVLPRTTYAGAEARSYALTMALAVVLTAVLLWGVRRGGVVPWIVYAAVAGVAMLVFVYLAMLVAAHLVALVLLRAGRGRIPGLVIAGAVAVAALVPFLLVVVGERGQVDWLAEGSPVNAWTVLVEPWFDGNAFVAAVVVVLLVATAVTVRIRRRGMPPDIATRSLLAVAAPWAVVPFALLLLAQATVGPLYSPRYLTYTTPGLALLISACALALPWRRAAVVVLAVLVVVAAPGYVGQRGPYAKNGGSDLRQIANTIAAHALAGDAVAFEVGAPLRPREALYGYPDRFERLDDIGLVQAFPATGSFRDRALPAGELPLTSVQRLWWVTASVETNCLDIPEAKEFARDGLRAAATYPLHRTTVCLFER